jgi:DNA repair protein RecN (Recombination protein N)
VEAAWKEWRTAEAKLAEARAGIEQAKADQDLLVSYLAELAAIEPEDGEEATLAGARADMQKGEKLSGDLEELRVLWDGSDSALATLRGAARRLDRIAGEHALLAEALAALDRAVIEAGEAEDKLAKAAEALTHDPAELDRIETRLFELRALARKHRCEVDELPAKMREMRSQLDAIEAGDAHIGELEKAERAAHEVYRARAEALHANRVAAALRLDEAVAGELAPLKLDAARFRTTVTELPEERWGAAGMDAVEFLISTNPGADFAPLNKIASGGELSRFILALKVALAEQGGAATVIFDEIDRGVGGAVASAIGERLARLAQGGQLLAVTHSPQVAARGNAHYVIHKSSEGTVTRTSVTLLDEAGRQEEIARMLSGAEITSEARAQADRLLEGV